MKLEDVFDNQELAEKLDKADGISTILQLLREAGVEMTEEELTEKVNPGSDQLSEESLENVSGGCLLVAPVIKVLWNWFNRKSDHGQSSSGIGHSSGGGRHA